MPVKRIKISEENELLLNKIKKQEKLTNEELWEKLICTYYEKTISETNTTTIILEYLKLLVKANRNLPTGEEEMNRLITADSRFDLLINKKVYGNETKKF